MNDALNLLNATADVTTPMLPVTEAVAGADASTSIQLDPWGNPVNTAKGDAGELDLSEGGDASVTQSQAVDAWGNPQESVSSAADPWGSEVAATQESASDSASLVNEAWLGTAANNEPQAPFIAQVFDGSLPVADWINHGLEWAVANFRPAFQALRVPIHNTLSGIENLLISAPATLVIALIALLAWQFSGLGLAVFTVVALGALTVLGIWSDAMVTLSLVLTSLVFCVLIGLPLGILVASSDHAQRWIRPLLDAMQTTPSFVYLVPVVMLFGIGNVPGVIVTTIFALPPLVRLTNLGIRQVRPDLIEAAESYGASPWQMLTKVQLPLALPSIMAGVNQALMLSLSMVVIASMIAVTGLGQMVLRGIGRLDMGMAAIGGLGVVLLAVTLDRITQAMGTPRKGVRHWWHTGPAGLVLRLAGYSLDNTARSPTSKVNERILNSTPSIANG